MKVYGLTGGIASGKSTVTALIRAAGHEVIDADEIVRSLYDPGKPVFNAILKAFGAGVLDREGQIDRQVLASMIFGDAASRHRLNAVTHPIIYEEVNRRIEAARVRGDQMVFVDVPLLFESNREQFYDAVILVFVEPEDQLNRLMDRNGLTADEAKARIVSQMPIHEKLELADYIIDNTGGRDQLKTQVDQLLDRLGKRTE